MIIKNIEFKDLDEIYTLYKNVINFNVGNLTQFSDELYKEYLKEEIFEKSLNLGLTVTIKENNQVIGFMKAYTSEFKTLAHVLSNTTVMIHPDYQNKKYGTQLINEFCSIVKNEMQHIYMIELLPHENNKKAISFYLKNGFNFESKTTNRILTADNKFENETKLVWLNPNFKYDKLLKYHEHCAEYLRKKYKK